MCFGSFDIFHKGHEDYFKQAKQFGDYLVVVVSRDHNFRRIKNREPLNSEVVRLKKVSDYKLVDKAVFGHEKDLFSIIVEEKPRVICLGYDQWANELKLKNELLKRGLNVKILRAKPFKPEKYKSSKLS